jgi:lipoprotein-anchoring transpeptidase ErfK/SrfK
MVGWGPFQRLVAGGATFCAALLVAGLAGVGQPAAAPVVATPWPALAGAAQLEPAQPPAAAPAAAPVTGKLQTDEVIVQPGDSLSMIAGRLGFSVCALEAANPDLGPDGGRSFDSVSAGDIVHVPAAEASCPQPAYVPLAAPPPPLTTQRGIVISLTWQHMWVFDGGRVIFDTVVTTGRTELPTPVGDFSVLQKKSPILWISPWPPGSPYYYAPTWSQQGLLYRSGGYWIHDAPWQTHWGPGAEYLAGSHGCINTPVGAMPAIYAWARVGDPVLIRN